MNLHNTLLAELIFFCQVFAVYVLTSDSKRQLKEWDYIKVGFPKTSIF